MSVITSMDFFAHQDDARRRTGRLLLYYVLAVTGIIAGLYLVLVAVLAWTGAETAEAGTAARALDTPFWNPVLFLTVSTATLLIVGIGTLYKTTQLARGGHVVARMLGGRPVAPDTQDAEERRLLNVVEEMSIASGLAMPGVFVLDHEPGINAFAAGFSGADAVIGVTRGAIHQLPRDELQGVIAHEFSHIANGDMRMNIRLMGVLHGILLIALLGFMLMRSAAITGGRRRRSRGGKGDPGAALLILGIAMLVIGYIGVFFSNLIKSAISRQREFLADASAVQYTRNPGGIAGALQRIGSVSRGARVAHAHAAEASHLFFGDALGRSMMSLMATHPPLQERIRRLDASLPGRPAPPAAAAPRPPDVGAAARIAHPAPEPSVVDVVAGIGAPTARHLAFAQRQLERLPPDLTGSIHDTLDARAVIYALLLDEAPETRTRQLEALQSDAPALARIETMTARLQPLPSADRLALANLALPALRLMPPETYRRFERNLTAMIQADPRINLLEYALQRMLHRHLAPTFGRVDTAAVRHHAIHDIRAAAADVLTAMAVWGSEDRPASAATAYAAGMRALDPAIAPLPFQPASASLERVDRALSRLAHAAPAIKKRVLHACVACVGADGRIGASQGELLHAVADALDCPLPPLDLS